VMDINEPRFILAKVGKMGTNSAYLCVFV
jgi:hypothetical protein